VWVKAAVTIPGMDLFARLLLYMSRWSRERPSRKLVITVCIAVALILVVVAVERSVGWPEFLTVNKLPRRPMLPR
jgi:hypothetical protein